MERDDYLVLVNKENKIPNDWEKKAELIEIKNAHNRTIRIEKETREMFDNMRNDLLKENIDIQIDSAYRSFEKQQELIEDLEEKYWTEYARKNFAIPWYSEHHTWLAIDICINKDWRLIYENHEMIVECEIFNRIHEKLADYWFILRFLEWKDQITGFEYEPWHVRYVWDVNVAKEIYEKWLTLEEYLDSKK